MYLSCLFVSVFFFFFFFDFHQEVAFNQYFYLYQEFMFLCAFLSVCLSIFGV